MSTASLLSPAPTGLRRRSAAALAIVSIGLLGGWMATAGAEVDATVQLNPNPAPVGGVVSVTMVNTSLVCNTDLGEVDSYIRLIRDSADKNDVEGVVASGTLGGTLTLPSDLPPGTYPVEFQCTLSVGNGIIRTGSLVVQAAPQATTTTVVATTTTTIPASTSTSTSVVTTTTAAPTSTTTPVSTTVPASTTTSPSNCQAAYFFKCAPDARTNWNCPDSASGNRLPADWVNVKLDPNVAVPDPYGLDGAVGSSTAGIPNVGCEPGSAVLGANATKSSGTGTGAALAVTGTSQSFPLAAAGAALLIVGIAAVRTNYGKKWYTSANGSVRYTIDSVTKRR